MRKYVFNTKHTFSLVDIVFGVIIAMPLFKVPNEILIVCNEFNYEGVTTILLQISSLLFCSFYWLGMHEYLIAQERFDKVIGESNEDEISLMQILDFMGGILLIGVLVLILVYSRYDYIKGFLIVNMLFWLCDIAGSTFIKLHYRQYTDKISYVQERFPKEFKWYNRSVKSNKPIIYG